jgi:hypothetical protein
VLDQELSRLPEKYRAVIVLCDLEGKTRREAARHFRVPEGTVASRLATARAMLARRLTRSGLALSGPALGAVLSQQVASAGVPASVVASTVRAGCLFAAGQGAISPPAVALAEGVLRTMLLTKLKIATAVLAVVAVLGTAAAAITHQVLPGRPAAEVAAQKPAPAEKPPVQPAAEKPVPPVQPLKEKKKEEEPLPTVVTGLVKAVDAGSNFMIVEDKTSSGKFNVAKDARIVIDGKPGQLASVPVGASISLREFVDPNTARNVEASGRWFWGSVKAIDVANNTLTFGEKAQDGAAGRTFVLRKDAFISIDGKPGNLTGIPLTATVNLQLCADQTSVLSLAAEGSQVSGVAKAVDIANKTITVNDTAYPVAQDTHVSIDHRPGELSRVPAGANVTLNLRVDQKAVLRISANGASIFGTVKAVDTQKNTLTISGHPDDRTYTVAPDTIIRIDDRPGKLADIPTGSGVHALNLRVDQQTADGINAYGPGYHHVPVRAVDPEKGTITLDDKAPGEIAGKTFPVASDANIQVDGQPGKLAGIPAGCFVNLGLSVDRQTARGLHAEGPTLGECGGSLVAAVDVEKRTITFDAKAPAEIAGKTFPVMQGVWIQIDNKPGKLADLPAGALVNLTLTVDQQTARLVNANGPRFSGVVKAVDAEKNTVTVDTTTWTVAKDALIVIDGKQGPLSGLPIGTSVHVNLRVDRMTVGMIQTYAP